MRVMLGALALAGLLSGCALLSPPQTGPGESPGGYSPSQSRTSRPPTPAASGAVPAPQPAPFEGAPGEPQPPAQKQFALGPAAAALVGVAHAQERSHAFGLAAQTLERALSIEPHNPLVWIELGRENILAGNAAQAYSMGRKALYLASGDPHAQAKAWWLIAASLRAEGRNDAAYVAQEKAAALSRN